MSCPKSVCLIFASSDQDEEVSPDADTATINEVPTPAIAAAGQLVSRSCESHYASMTPSSNSRDGRL